jgi:hypothetical protein
MVKKAGLKAVSTALATMAIILVLVLGMSWMAYMVVLNARQQAEMAGRAETVALKAKELIRVYVWLDPARQPDGRYLNLARISFVGEWSGETVVNGLLIAYTDGRTEVRNVNIRLGAGAHRAGQLQRLQSQSQVHTGPHKPWKRLRKRLGQARQASPLRNRDHEDRHIHHHEDGDLPHPDDDHDECNKDQLHNDRHNNTNHDLDPAARRTRWKSMVW